MNAAYRRKQNRMKLQLQFPVFGRPHSALNQTLPEGNYDMSSSIENLIGAKK